MRGCGRFLLFLAACKGSARDIPPAPDASTSHSTSTSTPTPTSTPTATATPTATPTATATPTSTSTAPPTSKPSADASASSCRLVRGPIQLPLRSPATLSLRGDTLDVVLDDDGRPRTVAFTVGIVPPADSGVREPPVAAPAPGLGVPCAVAGEFVFCPDRTGAVHRAARTGADDRIVASSRAGSRIGAAVLGDTHTALAYLASRKTSEGWVSEAWLAVDDDPPLRFSEDGSGATALTLVPRGKDLVALTVDARMALTAMHVRVLSFDGRVKLGEDSVVFVGGPGDRRTGAAVAVPPSGPAWGLLPIAKDVGSFGLSIVRLDDPPRVDEPVVWSMYPNGLDPAPVAAATGGGRTWVARVRPQAAEPVAPRVLELGEIAADGTFANGDLVPTSGNVTDVALALDAHDALWLAWVDGGGSWLERLACK